MLIFIKIMVLAILIGIAYQDFKERHVFLWVLIAVILLFAGLHLNKTSFQQYLWHSITNLVIIFGIILTLFLYSKFKLKQSLHRTFGLGDILFFIAIALGFPTISFIVLFSFSLFFSLIVYLLLKSRFNHKTVPLAGLQALFFSLIFLLHWTSDFINIYLY